MPNAMHDPHADLDALMEATGRRLRGLLATRGEALDPEARDAAWRLLDDVRAVRERATNG